jgi:hypothetical protein
MKISVALPRILVRMLTGHAAAIAAPNPAQQAPHRNTPAPEATLSPTPCTLYALWEEWQNRISGRKPARLFSAQERGRSKHKYARQKHVWDLIASHVRAGIDAHVAIDCIYAAYGGGLAVTTIINKLGDVKFTGTMHPDLVI